MIRVLYMQIRGTLMKCKRLRHSKGFGVQSPSAYSFITEVINEKYPYYAYSFIDNSELPIDKVVKKICFLYLRLANYVQPEIIVNCFPPTDCYNKYFSYGCKSCVIMVIKDNVTSSCLAANFVNITTVDILRISLLNECKDIIEFFMNRTTERSVFILENIHENRDTQRQWSNLINNDKTGVTYDLYYLGLIFFDKKRYKQNYIVNF